MDSVSLLSPCDTVEPCSRELASSSRHSEDDVNVKDCCGSRLSSILSDCEEEEQQSGLMHTPVIDRLRHECSFRVCRNIYAFI